MLASLSYSFAIFYFPWNRDHLPLHTKCKEVQGILGIAKSLKKYEAATQVR